MIKFSSVHVGEWIRIINTELADRIGLKVGDVVHVKSKNKIDLIVHAPGAAIANLTIRSSTQTSNDFRTVDSNCGEFEVGQHVQLSNRGLEILPFLSKVKDFTIGDVRHAGRFLMIEYEYGNGKPGSGLVSPQDLHPLDLTKPAQPESKVEVNEWAHCGVCGGSNHAIHGLFSYPAFSTHVHTGHKAGCSRGRPGDVIV